MDAIRDGVTTHPVLPRIVHRSLVALFLLGWVSAEKITYDDHVLPIFERSCLNCHNPDKAKGGLDLSSYMAALKGGSGGKIVEPGNLSSKLIGVVRHTTEPIMPPEGDAIPGPEIKTLEQWISGGLLENLNSKAKKPSKPKFNPTLTLDTAKPDGPAPLPKDLLLDPAVVAPRSSAVHSMALSPTAPVLAVTGQNQVLLYHSKSLQLLGVLPFPEGDPISTTFTPSGRQMIVGGGIGGKSGVTVSFDVTTGERLLVAAKEFDSILSADLHPDLSLVATGSPSKLIKLWKSEDGSQLNSIKKHTDWVTSVDFSNDGILLASGDRNGGVWVWEAATGNEFHTLRGHQSGITAALFRADSNLLATASHDGSVRMWEMNGGKEVKKIDAHQGGVLAFAWGRDGRFLTAGRDRTAKLWKADFNPAVTIKGLKDIPTAIALDTERGRAFIADYQGHIAVHELKEGKTIGSINANPPRIATRLIALRSEADASRQKLQEARSAYQARLKQIKSHETSLANLRTQFNESNTRREQAKQKIAATQTAIQRLEAEIQSSQPKEAAAAAALERQRAPLENQLLSLKTTQAEIARLMATSKSLTESLNTVKTEPDEAKRKKKIAEQQAQLKAAEQELVAKRSLESKSRQELDAIKRAIAEAEGHLNRLRQQHEERQAQLKNQREALSQHQKALANHSSDVSKIKERQQGLEKQVAPAQQALQKLQQEVKASEEHVKAKARQIAFWERAELKSVIEANRKKLVESEQLIEQRKSRYSQSTEEISRLEIELAEKRGHIHHLQDEISKKPSAEALARIKSTEASSRAEARKLESRLESIQSRLAGERHELDQSFQEIHQLRYQLKADEARHAALPSPDN